MPDLLSAIPEACLTHKTPGRMRIKVSSRTGDHSYFARVKEVFAAKTEDLTLEVNPLTGSLLFKGETVEADRIGGIASEAGLFQLLSTTEWRVPISRRLVEPVGDLSRSVRRFTRGEVDLPGLAFMALLVVGIVQILRGNLRAPPWYTAFWYAMGIFSKSIVDKMHGDE
ncbi:HMA2 domain-containing protein [Desulfatiglans anilini]|uniref:HMA2 domain-containing protein n=1 Tax=Desulfatiglans anilini TaxID=90728 RepID=UPI001294692B|nr:hypothetical protein [Desulfatiglans anilini]